ncbi:hypothetical protein OS242_03705 [Tumebacillus sp. DT12]|uniref:N-acetylmuramoyl-L-alanine amidase domain-containing protein n=1 Tax=Tumebacillus lacus TaxID=2995335 RepID=A0ABT3WWL2_9BACL|nr:hypothetical protein [Tumebacillus lacus]MCX7569069.1 hypothetical protein [Tumebacillus lacus]
MGAAMGFVGIVLHDSACPDINGSGFDFLVCRDGTVIPSNQFRDDDHIHVCVEGDFSTLADDPGVVREQMFVLVKLMLRLSSAFEMDPGKVSAHGDDCPGEYFPWHELKIRIDRPPH